MSYKTLSDVKERLERLGSFELNDERFVEVAEQAIDNETQQPKDRLLYAYKNLLAEVSQQMNQMDDHMGMQPTCQMGCAFCCYFPIIVTKLEANMIIRGIESMEEEQRDQLVQHLQSYFINQKEKVAACTSLDFEQGEIKHEYMKKQLPCPLLDPETNTCMAYEWRPLPCRTYVNYMDPKICEKQLVPEEAVSFEFLYEDYMGNLNEVAQEIAMEDGHAIDYPADVFQYNYLPVFLKEWIEERE
ncbi:YkgJ family cysteine cluster protein [Alkalibacillus aidingensis]|uniref:YkgJ family cysteine cluster protein n=1 Tax=Alkalibacillus aidingensis TaxID=2747607 RepID=UPI001660CFF5|nr:YkgJ family cysteine cluster protein [Alkalibacillus aidingensis]